MRISSNHRSLYVATVRPMKLDYQFLAQKPEKMKRAGGYYSLFIILIHDVKDLKTYKTQLSYVIMLLVFCFSSLYWLVYCCAWTANVINSNIHERHSYGLRRG